MRDAEVAVVAHETPIVLPIVATVLLHFSSAELQGLPTAMAQFTSPQSSFSKPTHQPVGYAVSCSFVKAAELPESRGIAAPKVSWLEF